VTWKVWTYPTSLTVGFQRAVVVEELDPALIAAVDATGDVYSRPRTRYDRTLRYFALISLGDTRSAIKASDVLVKVHAKAVGTEPLSGNPYDANDPHSQLWDSPDRVALDPVRVRAVWPGPADRRRGGAVLGGVRDRRRAPDL
jgi:uncharacterized protein (DUF2236 family)